MITAPWLNILGIPKDGEHPPLPPSLHEESATV